MTSLLPRETRDAVAAIMTSGGSNEYGALAAFAKRFNVESLAIRGDYGVFQSTIDDLSILGVYASTGRWAQETNDQLQRFFASSGRGTYIDIGANIGLTTVPISQLPSVICYALEPEPTNYKNLVENVKRNSPNDNVTALQIAAYHSNAELAFEIATSNLGDHRIHLTDEPGILDEQNRKTITVQAAPLDEIVPTFEGPLAVKIDTQGAEPFVVQGGKKTLARADLLIMEFWPYGMHRLGADAEHIYELLLSQFVTASLHREGVLVHEAKPMKEIIEILRDFNEREVAVEPQYFDITALRTEHI